MFIKNVVYFNILSPLYIILYSVSICLDIRINNFSRFKYCEFDFGRFYLQS